MHNLTAIYWIKDEARHISEYIEFHLLQGFDYFIFYDNGSTDNLNEVLAPYFEAGLVEVRQYPPAIRGAKNYWVMDYCCNEQKGKSKWIHFHSIDERIFCPDGKLIPEFLKDYEQYGGVVVAWEEFNSNGHLTRPKGLIIENYTTTFVDLGRHFKTITRPEVSISNGGTPHCIKYEIGFFAVTENHELLVGPIADPAKQYTFKKIKNHHYRTLSKEEFEMKSNKGVLDHGTTYENSRRPVAQDEWDYAHGLPSLWGQSTLGTNTDLLKWVVPVREALAKRYVGREHLLQLINH